MEYDDAQDLLDLVHSHIEIAIFNLTKIVGDKVLTEYDISHQDTMINAITELVKISRII